ncbi:hypothetical protein KDL01_19390 [Actinospica durhamensis]|uniref:Lipoprotein n=1 Tax=Actinospica durhamensis TaxID=1508375 RepID=A0A941EQS7_9ACTN|nr:hypothetical protein [Actinospica durhamensis]MBR7835448.1 hypothetical protein [Actinospica durhamensis]
MRKTTIGSATAGAVLCVLALAGCAGGHHGSTAGSGAIPGANTVTTSPAPTSGGQAGADGVPSGTPTGVAAVDSELNSVDQQLGVANTDLSQATAAPSDGG